MSLQAWVLQNLEDKYLQGCVMSGSVLVLCKASTTSQDMGDTFRALLHSLHITSPVVSVCIFWQAYSLVGNYSSQSSNIPVTVCVGHCFQPLNHQKQPSKLKLLSSLLTEISFLCQFGSNVRFPWLLFQKPPQLCFQFLCCYHLSTIILYAGWISVL